MSCRSVLVRVSAVLALGGWGGALWEWLDHGTGAAVEPGFIVALTAAAAFTVCFFQAVVMPDKARMYALGWIDRGKQCQCGDDGDGTQQESRRHLSAV